MIDELSEEEWEAEKAAARERIDAEADSRPQPTFMERLSELARELEPDMSDICTADQLLSGIDTPREMNFDEFMVFTRECLYDLQGHIGAPDHRGRRAFTTIGVLRTNRFIDWIMHQNKEWAILVMKHALSLFKLPFNVEKMPGFVTYAESIKELVLPRSKTNQTIRELIGE